jgi:hypothetical protein
LLMAAVAAIGLMIGCSDTDRSLTAPDTSHQQADVFNRSNPRVQEVMVIQERHTPGLMAKPEVVGTATGLDDKGNPAVLVLLESERGRAGMPKSLDGKPVVTMVTGPIKALKGKPGGPDHKARQTRPIELGVSGGNVNDLANGYCCSGTLGALVASGGTQYILSNSHVFAHDIASSPGDPDVAEIGDPIGQPGLIDVGCYDIADDYVAYLSTLESYDDNVDCAIAEVISGKVATDGSILEVGVISSSTVGASVSQRVKKSGRTSGLTRSKVSGLNATVNVGYDDECNGSTFAVLYTGQILISNKGSKFLKGGDSGSLMVEDEDTYPRSVGLLYAGSSSIAIANPIDDVLSYHGVSMVGN